MRSADEQPQLNLGEEIESFEISGRLIAQKSKIPNPTLMDFWATDVGKGQIPDARNLSNNPGRQRLGP